MSKRVLILPGDGIGSEIVTEAEKVLNALSEKHGLQISTEQGLIGGSAIDETGVPLPDETLAQGKQSDAILLGAVGGPKWDKIERSLRPERGLLAIRAGLDLYANLRPAILYKELAEASSLKPEVIGALSIFQSSDATWLSKIDAAG